MKLDDIMNIQLVFEIINLIRGGNHRLNHRNFIKHLKELDCKYSNLVLHTIDVPNTYVGSRGKYLKYFFFVCEKKYLLNFFI